MIICNIILRGLSNILPTPLTCMRATPFYIMHSSVTPPPLTATSTINIKKNYYLSDITVTKAFFSFIKREFMAKLLYGFILHCTGLSKWPWSVYCIIWGETLSGGKTCGYEECISPYVTFHLIMKCFGMIYATFLCVINHWTLTFWIVIMHALQEVELISA